MSETGQRLTWTSGSLDTAGGACYGRAAVVNRVILIGNLGKDPEVRFTPNGTALAKFPVATSERWTDQDGNRRERTEWHNIVVWGKQAETCGQYLSKGRQVFIEGSIRSRQYDDKEGNKRYMTEIVARDVRFLGSAGGRSGQETGVSVPAGEETGGPSPEEDDIPF